MNVKTVNQSLMVRFFHWRLLAEMADVAGAFRGPFGPGFEA